MLQVKKWIVSSALVTSFLLSSAVSAQQTTIASKEVAAQSKTGAARFGVVNTKKCLEDSKLGKQEQANFEKMKKQMESVLQERESELMEIEAKLDDEDYMDSISDEAAAELRRKKRQIRTDGTQLQNQYMQSLQKANMQIIQKLTDTMNKASKKIAEKTGAEGFDAIFTDEAFTFYSPALDVSNQVIEEMNKIFDEEQKEKASKSRS